LVCTSTPKAKRKISKFQITIITISGRRLPRNSCKIATRIHLLCLTRASEPKACAPDPAGCSPARKDGLGNGAYPRSFPPLAREH
jgi:hypothetical protein